MAHKHHSLGFCGKKLLKPLNRLYVKMVGRLVEKQHIGMMKQQFGKLYAHAPSSRKLRCRAVEILPHESETHKGFLHFGLVVLALLHCQMLGQKCHGVDDALVFGRLIVGAAGKLVVQLVEPFLHIVDFRESFFNFFNQSSLVGYFHLLRQIAYGGVRRHSHTARRRILQSGDDFQHG